MAEARQLDTTLAPRQVLSLCGMGMLTVTCDRGAVLVTPGNGTDLPLRQGASRRFQAGSKVVIEGMEWARLKLRW